MLSVSTKDVVIDAAIHSIMSSFPAFEATYTTYMVACITLSHDGETLLEADEKSQAVNGGISLAPC